MERKLTLSKEQFVEALTLRRDIDEDGNVRWYNSDGDLHRIDGPAMEYPDGRVQMFRPWLGTHR